MFFNYHRYYDDVSEKRFCTYVEVGCFEGDSISYLANALKPRWREVKIFGIDIFSKITNDIDPIFYKQGPYWERYNAKLEEAGVRKKVNDIPSLSHLGAEFFKDRSVDFVFLDAAKTYENVMRDLEHWYPKISGYGTLAGHDCFMPTVNRALQDFSSKIGKSIKIHPGQDVWELI